MFNYLVKIATARRMCSNPLFLIESMDHFEKNLRHSTDWYCDKDKPKAIALADDLLDIKKAILAESIEVDIAYLLFSAKMDDFIVNVIRPYIIYLYGSGHDDPTVTMLPIEKV